MNPTLRKWLAIATFLVLSGCGAVMQESPMKVKNDATHQLQTLAGQDNFAPNGALYKGVRDPALRANLNSHFGLAIAHFTAAVERKATKNEYLALLASEIKKFERAELETEDAEKVGTNFEHILDCIGLDSSEGILNNWMYGFDPKKL
jgi:hypothetical protein